MLPIKSLGVSIFLLKADETESKVLLLRRTGKHLNGEWCQIAGGIEPGETAWQTALREVHEETGILLTEIWSADILEKFYEPERECINMMPVFVSTVPEGTAVRLNEEHDAYEWVSFEKAQTMLSFFGQRKVLAAVKAEFVDKEPNPHLRIEMNG